MVGLNRNPDPRIRTVGQFALVVVAVLITLIAAAPFPQAAGAGSSKLAAAPSGGSTVTVQLRIHVGTVLGLANAEFWGSALYPIPQPNSTEAQEWSATGVRYALWPGGKANDGYDVLTNVMYDANGTSSTPRGNLSSFVTWCETTGCHAIIGLPGEINRPNVAAAEVSYIEKTLHFHAAFWEIGNEPGLWRDYKVPWAKWSASKNSSITPLQYANLVHRYIAAIRAIDPKARIIGLPGTGLGTYLESTYVYDTVKVNGQNLSAVALHIYPAGHLGAVNGTLSQFDQSLTGRTSLEGRVPLVREAIRSACAKCHPQVFVTEYNAATVGVLTNTGNYGMFMAGFDEVPYVAAEVTQGLTERVRNMDLWTFAGGYPGAMVASNGSARPLYYLYSTILPQLDLKAVQTNFSAWLGQFFGVASVAGVSGSTAMTLLLVNANTTTGVRVDMVGSGFTLNAPTTTWSFASGMSQPVVYGWGGVAPTSWVVGPESVLLVKVA